MAVRAFKLVNSSVLFAMHGIGGRKVGVFFHTHDSFSHPSKNYERLFYEMARPQKGLIGWGSGGALTPPATSGAAIHVNPLNIANTQVGAPQLPYDRTKGAFDADLQSRFFDTSANAFDGTTGVFGDFAYSYATELGFSESTAVNDGQGIYQFQMQGRDGGGPLDAWLGHQLKCVLFTGVAGANNSGPHPIPGPATIDVGTARGSATPMLAGAMIISGPPNSLQHTSTMLSAGPPDHLPALSVHSASGAQAMNLGRRTVVVGSFFISTTATEGLAILPIAVPFTCSIDYSLGYVKILNDDVYLKLRTATGFNFLIYRVGDFISAGDFSANNSHDMLSELQIPDYQWSFVESMNDWQNVPLLTFGQTIPPANPIPSLYIMGAFRGYGVTLAQAALTREMARKALEWGSTHPTVTPHHPNPHQVWLFDAAIIDPWFGVSIAEMLTGPYVRQSGTQIPATGEVWGAGRTYSPGDVICDPDAGDLLTGNQGWHFCKPGAGHTSSASGSDGPPSDPSQTRWQKCDLALNETGMRKEIQNVWQALTNALHASINPVMQGEVTHAINITSWGDTSP